MFHLTPIARRQTSLLASYHTYASQSRTSSLVSIMSQMLKDWLPFTDSIYTKAQTISVDAGWVPS